MELLLLAAIAAVFLLLLPGTRRSARRDRERAIVKGAAQIQEQMDRVFGGVHEYAPIELADLPFLDRDYYDEVTDELREQGFTLCADIEDLTMSRAQPRLRTCLRTMLGDSGLVRAGIAYWRPRGWLRLLGLLRLLPREIRALELVSEIGHGQFVCTSDTKGIDQMTPPPELRVERHAPGTPATELLQRHRDRVGALVRSLPHASPVHMGDYDDMLASMQRGNVILSRHRDQLGGLTREELERIVKRPLRKREQELLDALDRQRTRSASAAPEPEPAASESEPAASEPEPAPSESEPAASEPPGNGDPRGGS